MTPHTDFFLHPRPPTPPPPQPPALTGPLQVCHPHAAGIDIGAAEHWVAVPPGRTPQPVRRFGTWRAEHLCAFQQALALYAFSHQQIAQCAQQITAHLETLGDTSAGQPFPPKARRHTKTNAPRCEARTSLSRMAGVDRTTIAGIEEGTALVILSEIGTDMSRWPSVKHLCRWLGLCPQHQISGGQVLSRRVRPGAHRVTVALRLAARSVHHSQSAFGAFFRRMKARLGAPKALTATAHKLARRVSPLRTHGSASVQQGLENYEAQYHERRGTTRAKQANA